MWNSLFPFLTYGLAPHLMAIHLLSVLLCLAAYIWNICRCILFFMYVFYTYSKWFCIVLKVVEICDCMISAKSGICMFMSDARTCSMANCQYGCEVMKGEVRCQCPSPGLQLAPDGRTCVGMCSWVFMGSWVLLLLYKTYI